MPETSPEHGADATAPLPTLDPAGFPFIHGIERALRHRGTPLVRLTGPDRTRPATFRITCGPTGSTEWECLVVIDEHRETVAIRSILPIDVPPERLAPVATLVAHLNATRVVGHFAIEPASGRIVHVSGVRLSGLATDPESLMWLLGENLLAVDLHLAMFLVVAWTDIPPEAAMREGGVAVATAA